MPTGLQNLLVLIFFFRQNQYNQYQQTEVGLNQGGSVIKNVSGTYTFQQLTLSQLHPPDRLHWALLYQTYKKQVRHVFKQSKSALELR